MNDFERLQTIKDPRWANTFKCDIQKNIAEIREDEHAARLVGLDNKYCAESRHIHNLKSIIKEYQVLSKKLQESCKENILSGFDDRHLVERFGYLKPNEIKMNLLQSMFKIKCEMKSTLTNVRNKVGQLRNVHRKLIRKQAKMDSNKHLIDDKYTKVIMTKVGDMDSKIALVELYNKKTEKILDLVNQNLFHYDNVLEQLQNDAAKMSAQILEVIEVGTFFKEDEANFIQTFKDTKNHTELRMQEEIKRMNTLKKNIDLLEHSR